MDQAFFHAVNGGFDGPFMNWLMVAVTKPETWWPVIAVMAAGMVAHDARRGLVALAAALAAVAVGDALAHNVLKPFFGRVRPCAALDGVNLLVGCTSSLSFPSNHAVNSMALAGAAGYVFRPLLWPLVFVGAMVCVSRVAVGVHYPSDVIAGAITGFAIGWGFAALAQRLFLKEARAT